jgi:hypothetical protein
MRIIVDEAGRVQSWSEADEAVLVPPAGGTSIVVGADDIAAVRATLAGLAAGEEVVWDGAEFVAQQRPETAAEAERKAARAAVLAAAQSAVGVPVTALTAGQVRALVAALLFKEGGLDGAGVVRPLAGWVRE